MSIEPTAPAYVDVLFAGTAITYTVASVLFLGQLMGSPLLAKWAAKAPAVLAVAILLHAADIVFSSFVFHLCPVRGVHFSLSVLSLLAGCAFFATRRRYRIDVAGAFVAPLALTFLLASRFAGVGAPEGGPSARIKGVILPLHVAVTLLGESLFTLAFAAAILYLVEERRLKRKKLAGIFVRLPPLDALERAEHKLLLLGFPLLTVGILTGTLWAERIEAGSVADVWRAIFGYVTWLTYALVLLLRAAAGWRGRRASYGTIAGFGFSLIVLLIYLYRSAAPSGAVVMACR
jgi:ABC-type uncharacterized transport system permease subunit